MKAKNVLQIVCAEGSRTFGPGRVTSKPEPGELGRHQPGPEQTDGEPEGKGVVEAGEHKEAEHRRRGSQFKLGPGPHFLLPD